MRLERGIKKALRSTESRTLCPDGPRRFLRAPLELRLPGRVSGLRTSPTARYEYLIVIILSGPVECKQSDSTWAHQFLQSPHNPFPSDIPLASYIV